MVTRSTLTQPAVATVYLKGEHPWRVRIQHTARVPALGLPGAVGDKVQFLGRKARRVLVEKGVLYWQENRAQELADAATLQGWHDNGTLLDYFGPTVPAGMQVRVASLDIDEEASPTGIRYRLEAVEAAPTPAGSAPSDTMPPNPRPSGDRIRPGEGVVITNT